MFKKIKERVIRMAVFKVEKTKNFTIMSNHHLQNKNLSFKAKGLLSYMLSLPEDWDYSLAGLEYETHDFALYYTKSTRKRFH